MPEPVIETLIGAPEDEEGFDTWACRHLSVDPGPDRSTRSDRLERVVAELPLQERLSLLTGYFEGPPDPNCQPSWDRPGADSGAERPAPQAHGRPLFAASLLLPVLLLASVGAFVVIAIS